MAVGLPSQAGAGGGPEKPVILNYAVTAALQLLCAARMVRAWALPLRLVSVTRDYLYFRGAGESYLESLPVSLPAPPVRPD